MIASELIQVGDLFTVNAVNATGWYEIRTLPNANGELEVKGHEAHNRTISVSQLGKRKNKMGIISNSVEKVGEIHGKEMWVEDVVFLPHQERRGRKPRA